MRSARASSPGVRSVEALEISDKEKTDAYSSNTNNNNKNSPPVTHWWCDVLAVPGNRERKTHRHRRSAAEEPQAKMAFNKKYT